MIREFINQRPNLGFANYWSSDRQASLAAYRADIRRVGQDRQDALELLRMCELFNVDPYSAMTGRLTRDGDRLDYCAGQHYGMEYRAAVCRALSGAMWAKYGAGARNLVSPKLARRWFR